MIPTGWESETGGNSSTGDAQLTFPATEKRLVCPYCPRIFNKNDHFNRHVRSHTNEKPFGCKICGRFYPRRYVLIYPNPSDILWLTRPSDTLLRHFRMHDVRQGYRLQSLIINRKEQLNLENHGLDIASGRDSIRETPAVQQMEHDGALDYNDLNQSQLHGVFSKPSISLTHQTRESIQSGTTASQPIVIASSSTESVPRKSRNAILDLDNSVSEYRPLTDVDHPDMETSATNWLLDEGFMNLFDDWVTDPTQSEGGNAGALSVMDVESSPARNIAAPVTLSDVRQIWFVQVGCNVQSLDNHCEELGRHLSTTSTSGIDELFRSRIAKEFRLLPYTEALPSIDFMVGIPDIARVCETDTPTEYVHSCFFLPL